MEILLIKHKEGFLYPSDEHEGEKLKRFKVGAVIRCDVAQMRNYLFHRKFFALLNVGFDAFTPEMTEYQGWAVQKDIDSFREEVIIAAGFYVVTATIKGTVRLRPKSIKFSRMDQATFERLYSQVANVLLEKVLRHYGNRANLDNVVNQVLGFV
jgi:hypothetical protein